MDVKITPCALSGEIPAITSKSAAHRLLICAALSDLSNTPIKLIINDFSDDINATVDCLTALGASFTKNGSMVEVTPIDFAKTENNVLLNCGESGSTLRFLLPVAAAVASKTGTRISFTGGGRLPERPLIELVTTLEENGAILSSHSLPLTVRGGMKSGRYLLPGNISSQYISGLMFALPLLTDGDSEIVLSSPLQSAAYVDMTVQSLDVFGIGITKNKTNTGWIVKGGQIYEKPNNTDIIEVEKDWSNAAFFLAAGALASDFGITVTGLDLNSTQGDKRIVELLRKFDADIFIEHDLKRITVKKNKLTGQKIDISETPDLLQILAVVGAYSKGETVFYNAERLKLKESDRLKTAVDILSAVGYNAWEDGKKLVIDGVKVNFTGIINSLSDHRIAMSGAIAAIIAEHEVIIKNAEAVNKSYPAFFEDLKRLGGIVDVV